MELSFFLLLCGASAACYALWYLLTPSHDDAEPPMLWPKIPIIGHVIGMARHKASYYSTLRGQCRSPMYTLPLPKSKFYVVNSTDVVKTVMNRPNDMSSHPLAAEFATSVCGTTKETFEIIMSHVHGEKGDMKGFFNSTRTTLGPGPGLDGMNRKMIEKVAASLDKLTEVAGPKRIMLQKWLEHEITHATTESVYGPENPYRDPKVEDAFWDYEKDFMRTLMNVPRAFNRKAHDARDFLFEAFRAYLQKQGHQRGSALIQMRVSNARDMGISMQDIARFEIGNSIAILVNTNPTVFWIIFYLFSNPETLHRCRAEIQGVAKATKQSNGRTLRRLDVSQAKASCHYLLGVLQEVLRLRTAPPSVRRVMRDTTVGAYHLKEGSTLYMPSGVFHTDANFWGPDVADFRPERWLKDDPDYRPINPLAMRPFGGGQSLCPGRHFVTTEILAAAVMMVLRYDIRPVKGEWQAPATTGTNIASAVAQPDWDIEVEIEERKEFQGDEWGFELNDSNQVFAIAAEDKQ